VIPSTLRSRSDQGLEGYCPKGQGEGEDKSDHHLAGDGDPCAHRLRPLSLGKRLLEDLEFAGKLISDIGEGRLHPR